MDLQYIGTIVAIILGILGITQTAYQLLKGILKERRKIIIFCERTIEKWTETTESLKPETLAIVKQISPTYEAITIRAINNGILPIVITRAGFRLSNGEKIERSGREVDLPKRIEVGESVSIPFRLASLERNLMYQPKKIFALRKFLYRIVLFWRNPKIGNYRFRSPVYFDYVPLVENKNNTTNISEKN